MRFYEKEKNKHTQTRGNEWISHFYMNQTSLIIERQKSTSPKKMKENAYLNNVI